MEGYDYTLLKEFKFGDYLSCHIKKGMILHTLVFKNISTLEHMPFFSTNVGGVGSCLSPIASFLPTNEGWVDAINFCINRGIQDDC